jgi:hypothetical protein
MHVHTHTHNTHTHTYMYTHTHTHKHIHTHTHTQMCANTHTHTCANTHTHTRTHAHTLTSKPLCWPSVALAATSSSNKSSYPVVHEGKCTCAREQTCEQCAPLQKIRIQSSRVKCADLCSSCLRAPAQHHLGPLLSGHAKARDLACWNSDCHSF